MPGFADYLERQKTSPQVGNLSSFDEKYQNYLNQTTGKSSFYDKYNQYKYGYPSLTDEEKSRSVAMTGRELLEEEESPGFLGALWSGLKSGATLGYGADEQINREAMTFGEQAAELTGELAGGIIPFAAVSLFTGGYGAPVAAAGWMPRVYKSYKTLSRAGKAADKYSKQMNKIFGQAKSISTKINTHEDLLQAGSKLKGRELLEFERSVGGQLSKEYIGLNQKYQNAVKGRSLAESTIKKAQQEYIDNLVDKGARTQAARLTKRAAKSPMGIIPAGPTGKILGNSKLYKKYIIEPLAKKYGYKGAAIADRMANSAITFASVGAVSNKPGEGLIDRASALPKDAFMGIMFAASAIPTLAGKAWGPKMEPLALMALGGAPDYLTGSVDPNMDVRDRLLHGLGLVAFHYVGHGLSNIGVKDKMFKGLIDMGFEQPKAYEMAYQTKLASDKINYARNWYQKKGSLYVNKKNSKDVISIAEFVSEKAAEDGEQGGFIKYVGVGSDKDGAFGGKNIKEARAKLNSQYKKFDPNDPKLMDDLPPDVRANADSFMEGTQSQTVTIGKEKKWSLSEPVSQQDMKGSEIIETSLSKEQRAEKKFLKGQRKDLEKAAGKNRIFDPTRDIEPIETKPAYNKGDLVEWVKDGKEFNVDSEGNFYPMKIQSVDNKFAYINIKGSTFPPEMGSLIQQVEGKIPLSEIKTVKRTGRAEKPTFTYKLNLRYSNREDGKHHRKLKDTSWGKPEELLFNSREAAENYARENWVGRWEANESIRKRISAFEAAESKIEQSPLFNDYMKSKGMMDRAFEKNNFEKNEKTEVIKVMFPKSQGKTENLSIREMNRVTDLIKGDDSISFDVFDSRVKLVPDNIHNKINTKWGKALKSMTTKFKETILGSAAIGDMLGGWGATSSSIQKSHARFRNSFMGLPVELQRDIIRKLRWSPVSYKRMNEHIHALLDPVTFAGHRNTKEFKKFEKDMNSFVIKNKNGVDVNAMDWLIQKYRNFYDEAAIAQISSNSLIVNASNPKLNKTAFWEAYDLNGKKIELVDVYKNHELHIAQVQSILQWMKLDSKRTGSPAFGGKPFLVNQKGKRVAIDTKKSKHYYQKDYSPRQITSEFFDFINVPDGKMLSKAALHMAKNDKNLLKRFPKDFDARYETAKKLLKELQNIRGNRKNIYGQQYSRVADLPAYMYISRGKGGWGDILQMTKDGVYKKDGNPFKVGEKIIDANGVEHKVGKVIKVYETDYNKVLENYSSGLAHSTATYYAYGNKIGDVNGTINRVSSGLANQVGDNYYRDWNTKIMESQIYGEKQTPFSNFMRPITRWSAIAGLSSPLSGVKNLMLGNVQNVSVFTGRELWKGYLSRDAGLLNPTGGAFTKWNSAKQYAESIGATYQSSFDLHLTTNPMSGFMKRWLPNLGLMRTTEILNRTISSSIGPYSAEIHIANMAMRKNPATKGVNISDSRRILRDVLEYTPEQVNQMTARYKKQFNEYIKNEKLQNGDTKGKHFKFNLTDAERKQAAYQSHIITQGSGDLPYLPYWMGKGWAKPLTLFYRVAYRITDTIAKNVVKPAIVDGNLVPAMKYIGSSALAGKALYAVTDFLFDENNVNKFKDLESQWFDYFIRAEGLALFSNAHNQYGGFEEAFYPVPLRNIETVWDNLWDFVQGKKTGSTALGDGVKNIVSAYSVAEKLVKRNIKEDLKKYDDSKRRQFQFLDAYYPKENINLDYEDGITSKTPHYRAMRDAFWYNDPVHIAKTYYTSLAFLSLRIMEEKKLPYAMAEVEAKQRLKKTIGSLRPIPKSWMKTRGKTGKSRYMEYLNALSPEDLAKETEIQNTYKEKESQFYSAIAKYRKVFYKKG